MSKKKVMKMNACEITFTPIEDIDIFHILPYLNYDDIHSVLQTHKKIANEYVKSLKKYKSTVYCDLTFHENTMFQHIQYIVNINIIKNNTIAINKMDENSIASSYDKIKIENIQFCMDANRTPYLRIVYPNKIHTHIIYDRKIKLCHDTLLYTQ